MRERHGFTLIELLVVIAIISILAGILFPVYSRAREQARKVECQSNMKQVAMAFIMYCNDYDDRLPSSALPESDDLTFRTRRGYLPPPASLGGAAYQPKTWPELLYSYLRNGEVVYCPSDGEKPSRSQAANDAQTTAGLAVSYVIKKAVNDAWITPGISAKRTGDYAYPSDQVIFYERRGWHWGEAGQGDMSVQPKAEVSMNAAFMDAHVRSARLPNPLNGEPDYYNMNGETNEVAEGGAVDPRTYMDVLN